MADAAEEPLAPPALAGPDRRWPAWVPPLVFAALALAVFWEALSGPRGRIISAPDTDLILHFAASRDFGFGELAAGNFPLWNPRMFSGYPYFGGFQPALLYPPNWLYLLLPLDVAINSGVALHVFLAGWFTYLWLRGGGAVGDLAATAGGVAFMFCARFFLHVYAGHLPHLCLVPWLPLLLWAVDALARAGRRRWALPGAWAASMTLLAGYPQMLYFAMVVLPVYGVWRIAASPYRGRTIAGLAAVGMLSAAMCAAQLWAGAEAAAESVREERSYDFSATFSFPPENLLTAVAPAAIGWLPLADRPDDSAVYFGQAYLWEVSTHVGAVAVAMAAVGLIAGGWRRAALPAVMVAVTAALGLGANTPLHRLMYDWFPGFSAFRGSSKFFYLTSLFTVQLTAIGIDVVARSLPRWPVRLRAVVAGAVLALAAVWLGLGAAVRASAGGGPDGWFARRLDAVAERSIERKDWYGERDALKDAAAVRRMGETSSASLFAAGWWTLAAAAALGLAVVRPGVAPAGAIAAMVGVEALLFALAHRPLCSMEASLPPPWPEALDRLGETNRFVRNPSSYDYRGPAGSKTLDAWGYDPGVLDRYATLMSVGQGLPADSARWGLYFTRESPPIFRLARITTVLSSRPLGAFPIVAPPLPPAVLVPNAIVLGEGGRGDRDAILRVLASPNFDPGNTILLEREPEIRPSAGPRGSAELQVVDTDTRRILIDTPGHAVLLVTEAYSRQWVARPLAPPPAAQAGGGYRVMSGNWAFIAIPVAAGRHAIELSYEPRGWYVGRWISLAGALAFAATAAAVQLGDARRRRAGPAR